MSPMLEKGDLVSNGGQVHAGQADAQNWVVREHDSVLLVLLYGHLLDAVDKVLEVGLRPAGEVCEGYDVEDELRLRFKL